MINTIKELDNRFSETQLSEFAHDDLSTGYSNVVSFLQNNENDYTIKDVELIRKVVQRDCEIFGW